MKITHTAVIVFYLLILSLTGCKNKEMKIQKFTIGGNFISLNEICSKKYEAIKLLLSEELEANTFVASFKIGKDRILRINYNENKKIEAITILFFPEVRLNKSEDFEMEVKVLKFTSDGELFFSF